jgi:hypothetical protein
MQSNDQTGQGVLTLLPECHFHLSTGAPVSRGAGPSSPRENVTACHAGAREVRISSSAPFISSICATYLASTAPKKRVA